MNEQDRAAHRRAWSVIPWVVNGTASDADRHMLEAHVQDCEDCRTELAHQRRLYAGMSADPARVPDAQAGLERLWARIDEASATAASGPPGAAPFERRRRNNTLIFTLAAAVVVEAIGLSILGVGLVSRDDTAPAYQTLSSPAEAAANATIRTVPAPDMTLGELQRLLDGLQLQIVAGPNEAGAYALAPRAPQTSREDQLSGLRASPAIRFAEPIAAKGDGQ